MAKSVLIVEDDITFGLMLKTWLTKKGFEVDSASNIARARKILETAHVDIILSDLRLPDNDGFSLLKWMNEKGLNTPLIIMTSYADIQSAVQAIKLGARDYIAKPVVPEELLKKIQDALGEATIITKSTNRNNVKAEEKTSSSQAYLEGESDATKQLYNYVRLVAPTNMSVLINGASGTGKEHIAHQIHQSSKRAENLFIAIDCGAIPRELAASEFFGHVKGSFTGAITDKTGAFIAANGGTIFLDEVGNLSYEIQIQLLRVLQERKVKPIGSNEETEIDIRLISATNENLEKGIEKGTFREDLYHRINEFTLRMPTLKEQKEDILLFANFFLDQANKELDKHLTGFDTQAAVALLHYHWPGNLRQLKNVVMRATLLAQSDFITCNELAGELTETPLQPATLPLRNEETERKLILEALKQAHNNKSKAAIILNIDRKTLYNKLKLYKIDFQE